MIDDLNRKFNFMWKFFWCWFIFVAVLSVSTLAGCAYVVFLLLRHFGVV